MIRSHSAMTRIAALIAALVIASLACGLGGASPCAGPFVVTKTADTNDGTCDASDCSLREAVVQSNSCPGTQVIQIPAGTYVLTRSGVGEDAAATGDLDITDSVTINGTGNPVIDGNHTDRVFEIMAGETAAIDGVTVQNGYAQSGAGIRNHGILNLTNSIVQNNVASMAAIGTGFIPRGAGLADLAHGGGGFANGGGILSEGDNTLTMNTVQVIGNSADQGGGIMVLANGTTAPTFSFDSPTLYGATVANNSATQSGGGLWLDNQVHATLNMFNINANTIANDRGAGIYNASTLVLTHGKLTNNTGGIYGGGIYNEPAGDLTATDVFLGSNLTRMGAGIYNTGPARFYQSGFANNEANRGEGGAIYNKDADAALTLENVTISQNIGLLGGGGIFNDGGSFQINYSTIADNTNDGINSSGAGDAFIRNSILAGQTGANCAGTPPASHGFNIDSGSTCAFIEPSDLNNTDPMLVALAKNGGWSPTHALLTGSPAIDTADPDRCISLDEREVSRPQGPHCDRGAYEKSPADIDPTAGPTAVVTDTPTPAVTDTPTTVPGTHLTVNQNANCRKGPAIGYDVVTAFPAGTVLEIQGKNGNTTWVLVKIPPSGPLCWLAISNGTPDGSLDGVPVQTVAPLPDPPANFKDAAVCSPRQKSFVVTLTWSLVPGATGYRIYRGGTLLASLGGNITQYVDNAPMGKSFVYEIEAVNAYGPSTKEATTVGACKSPLG